MLDPRSTMFDQEDALEDTRVRDSARRLFLRLNPPVRDPRIAFDAPLLPVYDWEIAKDTEMGLRAVRSALQLLDGTELDVDTVNEERSVTGLAV